MTEKKKTKKIVEKIKTEEIKEIKEIETKSEPVVITVKRYTDKEIYESYLKENIDFKIFFKNKMLFDSSRSKKELLKFSETHLSLFGVDYSFIGLRFVFKK